MPAGLEVYNEQGVNIVTITDRLQRVIGSLVANPGGGSISVPEFLQNTPFYFTVDNNSNGLGEFQTTPTININGSTLSWSGGSRSATVIYGVY